MKQPVYNISQGLTGWRRSEYNLCLPVSVLGCLLPNHTDLLPDSRRQTPRTLSSSLLTCAAFVAQARAVIPSLFKSGAAFRALLCAGRRSGLTFTLKPAWSVQQTVDKYTLQSSKHIPPGFDLRQIVINPAALCANSLFDSQPLFHIHPGSYSSCCFAAGYRIKSSIA